LIFEQERRTFWWKIRRFAFLGYRLDFINGSVESRLNEVDTMQAILLVVITLA